MTHNSYFINNVLETCILEINIPGKQKLTLLNCYRPPQHPAFTVTESKKWFLEIFPDILDKLTHKGSPILVTGDFNLNLFELVEHDNGLVSDFTDIFASYGFIPVITRATHFFGQTATLIDNIFINNFFSQVTKSGVILTDISDHFPTFLSIKINNSNRSETPLYRTVRPMPLEKKQAFCMALSNFNWHDVLTKTNVDSAVDTFLNIFFGFFDFHFPTIRIKKNKKKHVLNNNFMTQELLAMNVIKNDLRKIKTKDPTPENIQNYTTYRNNYNKEIRKAKKIYTGNRITGAGNDTRIVWDILREASNLSNKRKQIGDIIFKDSIITNDLEKANIFTEIFSNVGKNSIKDLPPPPKNFSEYLPPRTDNNIFLNPTIPQSMKLYIQCLKPKSSTDTLDISAKLLHYVAEPISIPLSHIYNLMITTGIFPSKFKISKSVAIHKSDSKTDPFNYRGISLINNFSKVFEKILSNNIYDFLESENFFYKNQFGFRKNMSCNHAILKLMNCITKALNSNKISLAIFLDIQKCFDAVDHNILLSKLHHYGIRGGSK